MEERPGSDEAIKRLNFPIPDGITIGENIFYFAQGVAKAQLKKVVDGRPRDFDGETVKLHFTKQEWQSILEEVKDD
ncbi:hypothetical protein LCGC14_0535610 [marine sediment metagenome]|uniref:Uncharacterized protein n=1 Tax=marine sediment metagenome TaxID=412755 RepID=A0A0F9SCR3_9ZZZZ